ncbi:MAG: HAMP domain-containing histidine kinase [Clostridia bacterium]|nr:HAMP domain-containing histidine kinase [Clostridia bacterium]
MADKKSIKTGCGSVRLIPAWAFAIYSASLALSAALCSAAALFFILRFDGALRTAAVVASSLLFLSLASCCSLIFAGYIRRRKDIAFQRPLSEIRAAFDSASGESPSAVSGPTRLPSADPSYHEEINRLIESAGRLLSSVNALDEMRSGFMSAVSHDMRTPMTTISGFIDCILDGAVPPEKQEHYLRLIKSEVMRLSRLVSSLLDISRIRAGDRSFVFERFDICETARLILLSFEAGIDEKKLEVEFECDDDRLYVDADSDAVYQVIYNIVDNAVKFSRPGGKLTVSLKRSDGDIVTSVRNEGEGIAAEDQPFVFERFFKADRTRGLDKSGSGLGMYIAKTIVEAHGRRLMLDSVPGQYARFYFSLPESRAANIRGAGLK